jgi:uncharacterized protein (TIGR02996 family)
MKCMWDICDAIRDHRDNDANWLILADWLRDKGRDNEATAICMFVPAIRDSVMAGMTVEHALLLVTRHDTKLGRAETNDYPRVSSRI